MDPPDHGVHQAAHCSPSVWDQSRYKHVLWCTQLIHTPFLACSQRLFLCSKCNNPLQSGQVKLIIALMLLQVAIMFGGTQGAKSSDELEKEIRKEKEKHHRPPVTVSNLSSLERKLDQEVGVQGSEKPPKTTRKSEPNPAESVSSKLRDEDELFLLSLLPSIKRLTNKKKMEVRMKFQQVLYAAEFENGVWWRKALGTQTEHTFNRCGLILIISDSFFLNYLSDSVLFTFC